MSKSTVLFNLIKSLSPSEKRYFKVFYKQYSTEATDPSYLELFDLVDKMTQYDEAKLLQQIKNEQLAKDLSVYKNYLYNLILKSLRNFHSSQQAKIQLQEWLADVEILERKGLIMQALKRLGKAEKLAGELHLDIDRLKILDVKRKLIRQLGPKKSEPELEILQQVSLHLLAHIKLDLEVIDYYGKVLTALQSERGKKLVDRLEAAVQWLRLHTQVEQLSPRAQLAYHFIYTFYYRGLSDYQKAKKHYDNLIKIFDHNPRLKNENQQQYVGVITNYVNYCFLSKDFTETPNLFTRLKEIESSNVMIQLKIQEHLYYFQLLYHVNRGEFAAAVDLAPAVEAFLIENNAQVIAERQLMLHHNIGFANLMKATENITDSTKSFPYFSAALSKIVFIMNEPTFDPRQDIKLITKIFAAIIHLELENHTVAEFFIRSAQHQIKKKIEGFISELLIINCLRQLLSATKKEKRSLLQALYNRLGAEERIHYFRTWLQTRLLEAKKK